MLRVRKYEEDQKDLIFSALIIARRDRAIIPLFFLKNHNLQ
jgi:hypothetical protein